jgi:catechol 2,3-dioxygenase-like lactoylglutathione lyase family enzyme
MAEGSLDAVGVVVSDLKRSVEFYRLLGVPFEPGMEESEHGHAEAELDGGFRLMLDTEATIREFDPGWRRGDGASATLAFRCPSPLEVDQVYAQALQAGGRGHKAPWDAFWGQRYAQLRDPDGNPIDLYAALERE